MAISSSQRAPAVAAAGRGRWLKVMLWVGVALVVVGIMVAVSYPTEYSKALGEVRRVGGSTDADDDDSGPVRRVTLAGPAITDAQIEHVAPHLRHFPELFTLDLSMARVTDRGLAELGCLNHIGDLLLRYTLVTDDGLATLQGWDDLRTLDLMHTRVSDRGMEFIGKNLPGLTALDLDETRVTDQGLVHLKPLRNLEWLALRDTGVTDAGLETIGELSNLQVLSLTGTRVTDTGLKHLEGLKHLRILTVSKTAVSHKGVERLRAALPDLNVDR
jgi:hypothetical protein